MEFKQEKDLRELFEVENCSFASGLFACVKRARSRCTGQLYAAKHSPKRKENYNEIRLLSRLSSPYIIRFKDAFETSTNVIIIMEFAPGGDLQSLIDADVILNESHASKYIHQLLTGLAYLHSKSIAHLDIKPQNLLLMGNFPQKDTIIKICDFELSRVVHEGREEREIVGTPDYVAPEILQYDPITVKADIWSTGIVAYVLLTGFSPFGGETDTETFNNILHNDIDFPPEIFDDVVTYAGIEFITWLCQKNVTTRPSASTALQHVWLKTSRLSTHRPQKKRLSKSTYDLTYHRDQLLKEKTKLRKSKSREQLWRSKIHLSLSSEKIERWASLITMQTMTDDDDGTGQDKTHEPPIISEASTAAAAAVSASANHSHPSSSPSLATAKHKLVPIELTNPFDDISVAPGDKIKETLNEEEVQKSVAELISKFGGKKGLNPIEEDDNALEESLGDKSDDNSFGEALPAFPPPPPQPCENATINDVKISNGNGLRHSSEPAAPAPVDVEEVTVPAPAAPPAMRRSTTVEKSGGSGPTVVLSGGVLNNPIPISRKTSGGLAYTVPLSSSTSTAATAGAVAFVPPKKTRNGGVAVAGAATTTSRRSIITAPAARADNVSDASSPASAKLTTANLNTTATVNLNTSASSSGRPHLTNPDSKTTAPAAKKVPNRYTSRYEMKIGENSSSTTSTTSSSSGSGKSISNPKTILCNGVVRRARNKLTK